MSDLQTLSVDSLLAEFGAPETFDIKLPNGAVLKFQGFGTYAEKKAFQKEKAAWVKQLADAKNAAVKASNNDLLPGPFREFGDLLSPENLDAAYTIHRLCVSPGFTPVEAVKLTRAHQLISYIMDDLTWNSANYLVKAKAEAYGEAKKD